MFSRHNERAIPLGKKITIALFAAVLLAQVGFVIYKADFAGITYDEAFSFFKFGTNINNALTSYLNPNNNHVLNSIFICSAGRYFKSYEHFIRIHSIIFAILFSISIAYIIHKSINSNLLKIVLTGLVLFNWFVFDQSFVARGYSIALGAVYSGIAVILALLSKKATYRACFWLPAAVMSLMNFLAFGSMLSSLFVLLSINIIFVLLYSANVFQNAPNKRKPLVLNLISIPAITSVSLYLLYKNLYEDILAARNSFGMASFSTHIKELLIDTMVIKGSLPSFIIYSVFVFLTALGLVFATHRFYLRIKKGSWKNRLKPDDLANFILLITAGTILIMFTHRVILKMSLGYMRNGVFLVPLVLISSGIFIDRLCKNLKNAGRTSLAIKVSYAVIAILLVLQNLPSPYAIEVHTWKNQSISGPLVRRLKQIDPDKEWRIRLTKKSVYLTWPLLYYKQLDYKFQVVDSENWDVGIIFKTEKLPGEIYLDEDYFNNFDCYVLLNPRISAGPQRHVIAAGLLADEKR